MSQLIFSPVHGAANAKTTGAYYGGVYAPQHGGRIYLIPYYQANQGTLFARDAVSACRFKLAPKPHNNASVNYFGFVPFYV